MSREGDRRAHRAATRALVMALLVMTWLWPWQLACDRAAAPEPTSRSQSARPDESAPAPNQVAFKSAKVEFSGAAMGTSVTFIAYTNPKLGEARVRQAIESALAEMRRLEALMSSWRADSEISRLNANPGKFVAVSPETLEVIEKAVWAGKISEGTFDVTFQTLAGLWKFGDAQDVDPKPPTPTQVERLRPYVSYQQIEIQKAERRVKIGRRQQIGLGGIAKGYIVDAGAKAMLAAGVRDFLLRAGGDLYGAGRKPGGEPWVAGIQDPRGSQNDYFATLELNDHAFSTAGDYARSYIHAGKRYHHIIDPRTGYPAEACRSVTIWAENALLADVIDDSVFILGPERGLELVESLDGVGAVIVDAHNKVWVSRRLRDKVKILHDPTPGVASKPATGN